MPQCAACMHTGVDGAAASASPTPGPCIVGLLWGWFTQELAGRVQIDMFLTHGGLNSVMEASEAGVPLVCMGMFSDQPDNCIRTQYAKFGEAVDFELVMAGDATTLQAGLANAASNTAMAQGKQLMTVRSKQR